MPATVPWTVADGIAILGLPRKIANAHYRVRRNLGSFSTLRMNAPVE